MLLTVGQFCSLVRGNMNLLLNTLSRTTMRSIDDNEKTELKASYNQVSVLFNEAIRSNAAFANVQLGTSEMFLEYKLPAASAWCDLILLGDGQADKKKVIIVELKNWRKNNEDRPGLYEGFICHKNNQYTQHPSDQVRGYTEYCQRFHSTVLKYHADVSGLVYFTQDINLDPYREGPNATLVKHYPVYNKDSVSTTKLASYISTTIQKEDKQFAEDFEKGFYQQDRNILVQVAQKLKEANLRKTDLVSPFVLLDDQRRGYNMVMSKVKDITDNIGDDEKEVIVVYGPPGSGKSAIAANLWVDTALEYKDKGSIAFVTTSESQNDNWRSLFDSTDVKTASGLTLKASSFKPTLSGIDYKGLCRVFARRNPDSIKDDGKLKRDHYREVTDYLLSTNKLKGYRDNNIFISLVDEAHALSDPTKITGMVMGWPIWAGPMAYHIIRQSRISVFFMDDQQSFRDRETTSVADIEEIAESLGIHVSKISLEHMQFRCAGSTDYINWVDGLLSDHPLLNHNRWADNFEVQIESYPSDVDKWLRSKHTRSVRVFSSYSRPWNSQRVLTRDHDNDGDYDFDLKDRGGRRYQKYWNNPNGYQIYVQGASGSAMNDDPLSEIGCPYVVRGFDYEYVGLLWLDDLLYRDGQWIVDINYNYETGTSSKKSHAVKEVKNYHKKRHEANDNCTIPGLPESDALLKTVFQAYRIIMTRGIKGMCMYIKDKETRDHVKDVLRITDDQE